ncbi:MAG: hypothetical protein AAFV28_00530 [Cyanobacteria bacterium J06635_13]
MPSFHNREQVLRRPVKRDAISALAQITSPDSPTKNQALILSLSDRELEILQQIAAGLSNK